MENLSIINAKTNNLKGITLDIPLNQFSCITGVSGCGKSSLAYDTIYAESYRNLLECLISNVYGQKILDKPLVDSILNLKPSIVVSQNNYNTNPRSTIGTLSDLSTYIRSIFKLIINLENSIELPNNYFSFNNPESYCKKCKGTGISPSISLSSIIPNEDLSLNDGAISYYKGSSSSREQKTLSAICEKHNIDMNIPFKSLSSKDKDFLLYNPKADNLNIRYKSLNKYKSKKISVKGVFVTLSDMISDIDTPSVFTKISKYLIYDTCNDCNGLKLNNQVLSYKICNSNISEVENLPLTNLSEWISDLLTFYKTHNFYDDLVKLTDAILSQVSVMINLKLSHLSVSRSIPSLSSGELQRIRLANQLNCDLNGLIYILDEPCKGLHPLDIQNIIDATFNLVKKGNTVIAIEHNKKYINNCNNIIELGPVGGSNGGYLLDTDLSQYDYNFTFKDTQNFDDFIEIKDINFRNIKNQNIKFPIGKITCITGVSGSGKSSLVSVILKNVLNSTPLFCKEYFSPVVFKKVEYVNQQPIGKTPRSTVISFLDIYDDIRNILSQTPKALELNLSSSDFSMNTAGGRCESCQGYGKIKVDINHLPDSYITCSTCNGKRFNNDILSVNLDNKNIYEILNMSILQACDFFKDYESIHRKLLPSLELGVEYIKLGQMSMTLSGGEAQRMKLAKCLTQKKSGKKIFFFDEPTSGLHTKDIDKFSNIIQKLSNLGETVVIIEHNFEFISCISDYIIDMGKSFGSNGGTISTHGVTKDVIENPNSSLYQLFKQT